MIGLLLVLTCSETMLFSAFKLNQTSIIEKLCINKENPEMKCDGKCYLKTQLKKTNKEDSSPNQIPFELVQELSDFCQDFIITTLDHTPLSASIKWINYKEYLPASFPLPILQPPQL